MGSTPRVDFLQLKIDARKDTAITINADGKRSFKGTLNAGQSRTFNARKKLEIRAQDGSAVSLELNGQSLAPIGGPGKSGKLVLTRRNLKSADGGRH